MAWGCRQVRSWDAAVHGQAHCFVQGAGRAKGGDRGGAASGTGEEVSPNPVRFINFRRVRVGGSVWSC